LPLLRLCCPLSHVSLSLVLHRSLPPLQPTLSKLGVQLDTRTVTAIVREEKGIAARLVYMLKMSLDSIVRDVQTSKLTGRGLHSSTSQLNLSGV
jgi:hypothetical protein